MCIPLEQNNENKIKKHYVGFSDEKIFFMFINNCNKIINTNIFIGTIIIPSILHLIRECFL